MDTPQPDLFVSWDEFATRYCDKQESTQAELLQRLHEINRKYVPQGFFMLECVQMDSSYLGQLVILPYGGKSTHPYPPTTPVSPRGLASDMSTVCAVLPLHNLPNL